MRTFFLNKEGTKIFKKKFRQFKFFFCKIIVQIFDEERHIFYFIYAAFFC